jgi:hypothetical protein
LIARLHRRSSATATREWYYLLSLFNRRHAQVTVVDGPSMLKDWSECDSLKQRKWQRAEDDERSVVDLLTEQLEFADVSHHFKLVFPQILEEISPKVFHFAFL